MIEPPGVGYGSVHQSCAPSAARKAHASAATTFVVPFVTWTKVAMTRLPSAVRRTDVSAFAFDEVEHWVHFVAYTGGHEAPLRWSDAMPHLHRYAGLGSCVGKES